VQSRTAVKGIAKPFKATLGSLGKVIRGTEITQTEAVVERKAGRDIVICGGAIHENRGLARIIESSCGPCVLQPPHADAGPYALPHLQPSVRPPMGHSFSETDNRKAARNP
jgi:hypothetical protein